MNQPFGGTPFLQYVAFYLSIQALSCAGGFFSGMTVGLNSLDKLQLQVQQITGNQKEKKMASRILNTIKDHHLFLVTLLIDNAMVLQWLPLVVHKIMPDWAAILTSTVAVVIVAEIAPMSYTTGPSKYEIAFIGSPIVDLCIKIFYFIAYPIARGLDALLGVHDSNRIQRRDFLAFVNDKRKNKLQPLQITMLNQLFAGNPVATVKNVMTSLDDIIFIQTNQQIDQDLISTLQQNSIDIIFAVQSKSIQKEKDLSNPIQVKRLLLSYLNKKSKSKINKNLKLCQILDFQNKLNQRHQIPVIFNDTGLLDASLILKQKKSFFAFVHRDERKNKDTNIAFLDSKDFQVQQELSCSSQIIGIIFANDLFEAITDFKGDTTSIISTWKEISETPTEPQKRKLIKKASIISVHSSYSLND